MSRPQYVKAMALDYFSYRPPPCGHRPLRALVFLRRKSPSLRACACCAACAHLVELPADPSSAVGYQPLRDFATLGLRTPPQNRPKTGILR